MFEPNLNFDEYPDDPCERGSGEAHWRDRRARRSRGEIEMPGCGPHLIEEDWHAPCQTPYEGVEASEPEEHRGVLNTIIRSASTSGGTKREKKVLYELSSRKSCGKHCVDDRPERRRERFGNAGEKSSAPHVMEFPCATCEFMTGTLQAVQATTCKFFTFLHVLRLSLLVTGLCARAGAASTRRLGRRNSAHRTKSAQVRSVRVYRAVHASELLG